ncbi:MAG: nuclear transport factor 2 family protein [Solirubrobacterales bacterium]
MSQENVEIVRAAFDAYNRGDVGAAFKDAAPDFELDMSRAVGFNIDRDVYDLAQFRRLLAEFAGSWESFRLGADEFIDAGEHVVTPFTNRARGRDGIELQARGAWVWTIRDRAIVRGCLYQEREEALEAAGLGE